MCGLKAADAERLSLYIELNVAFKLTVEDSAVVPQAEAKVRALVQLVKQTAAQWPGREWHLAASTDGGPDRQWKPNRHRHRH